MFFLFFLFSFFHKTKDKDGVNKGWQANCCFDSCSTASSAPKQHGFVINLNLAGSPQRSCTIFAACSTPVHPAAVLPATTIFYVCAYHQWADDCAWQIVVYRRFPQGGKSCETFVAAYDIKL